MDQFTLRQALLDAKEKLENSGVEDAIIDAEVLLADLLGKNRVYLFAHSDDKLDGNILKTFCNAIDRRSKGEPVAYIIGCREFMSLEFKVDSRVLIPRPETELLVEMAVEAANRHQQEAGFLTLVDVGTGSGAIAVSGAKYIPASRFYAIDISPEALMVAQENAAFHGVDNRITFVHGNLLEPLISKLAPGGLDMVLANLPYIPDGDLPELQREVRLYEPGKALGGGPDGLDFYRELIPQAGLLLKQGGLLLMEIDWSQGEMMKEILQGQRIWDQIKINKDYAGKDRLVSCVRS